MTGQHEIAKGWREIAHVIGTTVRTAQRLASRDHDPLPIRVGITGTWAFASALRDFKHRNDLAYQKHVELRRLRQRVAELEERR